MACAGNCIGSGNPNAVPYVGSVVTDASVEG